ncbi:YggT family protein [Oceanimonas sp. CHS3-5]|uniref:YggT family protein n=1 Tax=Oceanimonas sp. CHS3-5 TaxID=3068186 RepID=UPI002740084A|nr:YggT family protein [Oceanimonas sp. CHS3-5]MDP5292118.1 YggT family protein [Oceanimonas sp. CHS3-5]
MNTAYYLINTVFDLYLMVVLLRIWLQLVRADFYNPFSQFVVKATNPVLKPLRRMVPGFFGIDMAAVLLALIVATVKLALFKTMNLLYADWSIVLLVGLITVLKKAGAMLFWILIIRALLSWISQGRSQIEYVMYQLTEPLLAPLRRIIPPMGGLDLSILVAFIALQALNWLMGDLFGPLWWQL